MIYHKKIAFFSYIFCKIKFKIDRNRKIKPSNSKQTNRQTFKKNIPFDAATENEKIFLTELLPEGPSMGGGLHHSTLLLILVNCRLLHSNTTQLYFSSLSLCL